MKMVEKLGNIWIIYSNLCGLRKSYVFYDMVIEDVYDVNVLKWLEKHDFVSKKTLQLMSAFINNFLNFVDEKEYRKDQVFAYLDTQLISILDHELKDFLESLNSDLNRAGFTDVESLEVPNREFPSNEVILNRVADLYDRLNGKR
jgi:hypothetical protein